MTAHTDAVEQGVGGDSRQQRRDDRDTLAVWRERMHQGRQKVLAWLDDQVEDEDSPGYARTLLQLRHSTDDRVRLGALKIEGELREWLGHSAKAATINVDARSQTVQVFDREGTLEALADEKFRRDALGAPEKVVDAEAHGKNGET